MKKSAIIVAGGSGTRLGGGLPKQFRLVAGRPMLWWSLKAFHDEDPDTRLILVLPDKYIDIWGELYLSLPLKEQFRHSVVPGGDTRTSSVKKGLSAIMEDRDCLVAVHDAARPLVTKELISEGWKTAGNAGAAVPAVAVTDSLRKLSPRGSVPVDRSEFVAVQTPQVFRIEILRDAYRRFPGSVFSDDAAAVENAGYEVTLFDGCPLNMKVTNPGDIEIAGLFLKKG